MRSDSSINKNQPTSQSISTEEKKIFFDLRSSYQNLSSSYLRLKKHPWKQFADLLNELTPIVTQIKKGALLDAGAGNGRNMDLFQFSLKVGLDPIAQLVSHTTMFSALPVIGSVTHPPFKKNSFDLILLVAVIHHFKRKETHELVIKELFQLLRPEGVLILTAWKRDRKGRIGQVLIDHINGINSQDDYLPWKDAFGKLIATRYYHYFTRKDFNELINLFSPFLLKWGSFGGKIKENYYAVFKKPLY